MKEKKTYQTPDLKVVELDETELICVSDSQGQIRQLEDDDSYYYDLF